MSKEISHFALGLFCFVQNYGSYIKSQTHFASVSAVSLGFTLGRYGKMDFRKIR